MNLSDSDDDSSTDSFNKDSDDQNAAGEGSNGMSYYNMNNDEYPNKRKLDQDELDGVAQNNCPYYSPKKPHLDYGEGNYNETHESIRLSRSSGNDSSAAEQDEHFEEVHSDNNDDRLPAQNSPDTSDDQNSDEEISDKPYSNYGYKGFSYSEQSVDSSIEETNIATKKSKADVGWKLMGKMGYTSGKGLGKLEHGRTEPVEASTQKGRRGLGLQPSKVGDLPDDFKFEPAKEDEMPDVREDVDWMKSSPPEPLTMDELEHWLQKGHRKKTIDDETTFVDPEKLHGVLNSKTIFDNLSDEQFRDARFRSNPYETIGSVIFLNRAAVKMANLDAVFDFMFTNFFGDDPNKKKEVLYFADVCAGPGGFSEYVLYKKGWKAKGFGFTLRGDCDFKLSNFLAGTPETFNTFYGVDGDGDIFKPGNLSSLKENVLRNTNDVGVHFLMADGGFSVEGNKNIQEVLSKQLYLCQCLAALMLVRTGGHFVVKLFDVFTKFSVSLIYIMYRCFDYVSIHKPVTSRPANSERYLICKYKRSNTDSAENYLYSVNSWLYENRSSEKDITSLVPLDVLRNDTDFFEYIYNSNCRIAANQISYLLKIAEYSKDTTKKDLHQNEIRELCLHLWHLPNETRKPPKVSNIDQTFQNIIFDIKSKPLNYNNLVRVKQNILNCSPKHILKIPADLLQFSNVLKWRFVFLGTKDKNKDLKFFLGNGGKQVYQLEGTKWKLADMNLTLPAKTLFYGEMVKEFNEGGKLFIKTVHIIDAVMLGGVDISGEPLQDRLEQCALFCTALEKPFDTTATALKCKKLYNFENFGREINKLEIRPTKQDRNAVTVNVPRSNNTPRTFFAIGSVLFIREVKEPWNSAMSKSKNTKYYHMRGRNSIETISPDMVNDMFSWFASRIIWEWDVPIMVYKSDQDNVLNCSQVLDYVNEYIYKL